MFANLSLRLKLLSLALMGAVGTIVVGAVGYLSLGSSITASQSLMVASSVQRAQMDADMMHDAMRSDVYSAMLAGQTADDKRKAQAAADLREHGERFKASIATVIADVGVPEIVQHMEQLKPALDGYVAKSEAVVQNVGGDFGALAQAIVAFEASFASVEGEMGKAGDLIEANAQAINAASASRFARAKFVLLITVAVTILLVVVASNVVERRITSGLHAVMERMQTLRNACVADLKTALQAMTRGDLSTPIEPRTTPLVVRSSDEVGKLTETFNEILGQTKETILAFDEARGILRNLIAEANRLAGEAKEGRLQERGHEEAFEGSFRELVQGINHTLDAVIAPVNAATVTLERLAQRDLTSRVDGNYRGDHARIQSSLNSAIDKLAETMGAVADTAEGVASSAVQIEAGSKDVASGASDQAASLEEVSASARELAAMTKRNAASAAEGRSLADGARSSTSDGVTEVKRLAEAIAQIKQSAEATAKIVKTIDEIAFQTNLLALNAAVEAARAGDSGRGFAVVADEVRSLAMRSADAAKNTAELIDQSVRSTEQGVQLNARVLSQLSEIDDRVNRVGQVVGEIAVASDEQAKGVELIDRALEEMSLRTQSVAAAADESEGASRNLSEQSETLRSLVGQFTIQRTSRQRGERSQGSGGASGTGLREQRHPRPAPSRAAGHEPEPAAPARALAGASARVATAQALGSLAGKAAATKPAAPAPRAGAGASKGSAGPQPAGAPAPAARPQAGAARAKPPVQPAGLPEIHIPLDDDDWNTVQNF